MRDVVRAVGGSGHVATEELVRAMRAGLDGLEPMRDRIVDRLVVAGLEVEEWKVFGRSPIASEEGAATCEIERTGDVPSAAARHDEYDLLGHRRADAAEEVAREIRAPPFGTAGVDVKIEKLIPVALLEVGTGEPIELYSGLLNGRAFLAQVLPFRREQLGEEVVECIVGPVLPLILL